MFPYWDAFAAKNVKFLTCPEHYLFIDTFCMTRVHTEWGVVVTASLIRLGCRGLDITYLDTN